MELVITVIITALITAIIMFFIIKLFFLDKTTSNTRDYDKIKHDNTVLETHIQNKDQQIKELQDKNETLEENIRSHEKKTTTAETQLTEAKKHHEEYIKNIKNMQEQTEKTFENLANKVLKNTSDTFEKTSQKNLETTISPLKDKLKDFKETVDKSFSDHAKEQHTLRSEIDRMIKTSNTITSEAKNLTQAIKGDSKMQGNWGEFHLERLLEQSGLRKNTNYKLQVSLKDEKGYQRPDAVVYLPDNKHIIIDAKVSLTNYADYYNESDVELQASHLKKFIKSVEEHVKNLSDVSYHSNTEVTSPDFVFMFMPTEPAYILAMIEKPTLHSDAWRKKVVIVSPTTLLANLTTVASLWRLHQQQQNTLEIARQGAGLYDKFVGFVTDMESLDSNLTRAQTSYDNAFSKLKSGNGNLITRVENLRKLGVPSKKQLSTDLIEAEDDDDTNLIPDNTPDADVE